MATQVLLRLYHYTRKKDYLKMAEKVLRLYYDGMGRQPFGFAHMFCTLDFYLERPKEIFLVGKRDDPAQQELIKKIHALYLPNKTLRAIEPGEPSEKNSPLLEGKIQVGGKPTVYVCHNFTCSLPVTEWKDLKELLEAEIERHE